ncbi:MAG: hypothetical protein K8R59_06480 [Thermoanaerobaculales bacterium]|nr:hypothetical protein [Thermoanaerobaculales bacterium]
MKKTLVIVATLLLVVAGTVGAADGPWLNVHVTEADSNTTVKVHLPLNLVLTVIENINVEGFDAGKIKLELDETEIDWAPILAGIKDAPLGEYVTVNSDEADVVVTRTATGMLINVDEKSDEKTQVEVNIPSKLIDAFQVDEENRIDIAALLRGFEDLPNGDLVRVNSSEATVRVWVE